MDVLFNDTAKVSTESEAQAPQDAQLLHHHPPHSLRPKRHRPFPSPICLDLELLILGHHLEEPVVHVTRRVDTVGSR